MPFLIKYWKQLAAVALILIIFLFGYYQGHKKQKALFDAFKLEVAVNAKLQEQKNIILQKQQTKITESVTKDYNDAIKKLNDSYAANRMLKRSASSSQVSQASKSSSTTNGETESNLSDTIRDCSLDVLQLLYLQEWIRQQELINEEGF